MKKCGKCNIEKPLTEFYLRKSGLDQHYIHRKECKVCRDEYVKQWKEKNKEKANFHKKQWRINNTEQIKEYRRSYVNEKYNNDLLYKIKDNISSSIRRHLKVRKSSRTLEILGCSIPFLIEYIESKFQEGMTWENHKLRGWHIDHIIPLSSAKSYDDIIKLNHYTNLQPLWWQDNLQKSDKIL